MARTSLFRYLRSAMRQAAARSTSPLPARLLGRRQFLQSAAAAAVAAGGGTWLIGRPLSAQTASAPRIAIVGGGISGLNAAYTLKKAGFSSTVYEGSTRIGGRMFSVKNALGPNVVSEFGAEFIDTPHEDMLNLAKEFGLELMDVKLPEEREFKENFFFEGKRRTEEEVIEAFRPLADKMIADLENVEEIVNHENPGGAAELDAMSVTAYLDKIGAEGWIRKMLDVAFETEYGLKCNEQSALNMLFVIGTDTSEGFSIFGESDERFRIKGGNDLIIKGLEERLKGQVQPSHKLKALTESKDTDTYVLEFETKSGTSNVTADIVLMTIPFTMLREVKLNVELPEIKKRVVAELGYGTNAKLMIGFKDRPWRAAGLSGDNFTDEASQSGWENTRQQDTSRGGLTVYLGGPSGVDVGKKSASEAAKSFLPSLEKLFPGVTSSYAGTGALMHWPSQAFTKGSYACYKVGQWTTIGGAEMTPVGNLFFAGEHCSYDWQGFMNGGAETGRVAAENILETLKAKV